MGLRFLNNTYLSTGEFNNVGIDVDGELGTSVGVTMDTNTDGGGERF